MQKQISVEQVQNRLFKVIAGMQADIVLLGDMITVTSRELALARQKNEELIKELKEVGHDKNAVRPDKTLQAE